MNLDTVVTWLKDKKMILGGIAILVIVGLIAGIPQLRSLLNANQGATTALLTFMLIVLYFGQYRLLDQQIQLENRPHLDVEKSDEDGDEMELYLSNLGHGPASDIELETSIDFEDGGLHSPGSGRSWMRRVGDEGDKKRRVGNSLKAGRSTERFVGPAVTQLKVDGELQGFSLKAAFDQLRKEGVDEVIIDFDIVCTDLLGNEYRETVYGVPYRIEIPDRRLSLEEAMAIKKPVRPWEGI